MNSSGAEAERAGCNEPTTLTGNAGFGLVHRLFFVDGSGFSMSNTAKFHEHFDQPSGQTPGCGIGFQPVVLVKTDPLQASRRPTFAFDKPPGSAGR